MTPAPDTESSPACTKHGRPCVVLFSGGLDSTTTLLVARSRGFEPVTLTFRYGQRHGVEVDRAAGLAADLGAESIVQDLDLAQLGGSALTDRRIEVPRSRDLEAIARKGVPPTYVPARNTVFLSLALAWAEVRGARDIFIGVNALDYSGYPDCRPEYVEAFERLANLACRASTEYGQRIRVHAPLVDKSKAEIIRWGLQLGADFSRTWSCYAPRVPVAGKSSGGKTAGGAVPCGECDSCLLRQKGFEEAGVPDPAIPTVI